MKKDKNIESPYGMERIQHTLPMNRQVILFLVLINGIIIKAGFTESAGLNWWLVFTFPLLLIAILSIYRKKPREQQRLISSIN